VLCIIRVPEKFRLTRVNALASGFSIVIVA